MTEHAVESDAPTVSVGLPVYNGGRFLAEAIESILDQTFDDFELIISDNASTDDTAEICRSYATRDKRIRYFRNGTNRGAQYNQNHVVRLARGHYFKLASHNDKLAPEFLRRCVEVLDAEPAVVLCSSRMTIIDETGAVQLEHDSRMHFSGDSPHMRLRNYFASPRVSQTLYGVVRSEAMKRTEWRAWYGSDRALLQELALHGCFHILDESLFYFRAYGGRSWFTPDRAAWFAPKTTGRVVPGYWMHLFSSLQMLVRMPMTWGERALCVAEFARQGTDRWRIWAPILFHEVQGTLDQRLRPLLDRTKPR